MLVAAEPRLTQGDLIYGVPFLQIPSTVNLKTNVGQQRIGAGSVIPKEDAFKEWEKGQAAIPVSVGFGVIVSQSCDIDQRDQVAIARVDFLENLVADFRDAVKFEEQEVCTSVIIDLCRNRGYNYLAYMGKVEIGGEPRHLGANLLAVQVLPRTWQPVLLEQRLFSLTEDGLRYLQAKLNNLTGRFALDDDFFWAHPDDRQAFETLRDATAAYSRLREKKQANSQKS